MRRPTVIRASGADHSSPSGHARRAGAPPREPLVSAHSPARRRCRRRASIGIGVTPTPAVMRATSTPREAAVTRIKSLAPTTRRAKAWAKLMARVRETEKLGTGVDYVPQCCRLADHQRWQFTPSRPVNNRLPSPIFRLCQGRASMGPWLRSHVRSSFGLRFPSDQVMLQWGRGFAATEGPP